MLLLYLEAATGAAGEGCEIFFLEPTGSPVDFQ
jgi:hypothetical protein